VYQFGTNKGITHRSIIKLEVTLSYTCSDATFLVFF